MTRNDEEVKNMTVPNSRYLAVKYDWIERTGYLLDACVLAYIAGWENDQERATVRLKIKTIAKALNLGIDQTQKALVRLEKGGFIAKRKSIHCYIYTTRKEAMRTLRRRSIEPKNGSISNRKTAQYRAEKQPDNYYSSSFKNDFLEESSSESFAVKEESSEILAKPLAAAAAARSMISTEPVIDRQRKPLALTPEQVGLAMQVLGPTGDERRLGELLTPEQAETPGFIDFLLRRLLELRNSGKLRSPYGMLKTMIRNDWHPGWIDPDRQRTNGEAAKRKRCADILSELE